MTIIDFTAARRATQEVPSIPRDADGPVFREPWEAQAFAMALALHERGVFTWGEWAATLGDEIKRAQAAGDPDTGETYYRHWLAALERLVAEKGVTTRDTLDALSRRLGPRLRPHPARQADRTASSRISRKPLRAVTAGLDPAIHEAGPLPRQVPAEHRGRSSWMGGSSARTTAACDGARPEAKTAPCARSPCSR